MKGLPRLLIVAFSLLFIVGPALADPVKTATIDLLLQREGVGTVFIDDERGQIYFERIAPAWSPVSGYAFAVSPSSSETNVKKLYVAPMDGSTKARPLFNQAKQDVFVFARSVVGPLDVMSPDGRYLAIHHLKDGVERLGVYDLKHRKFTYVDAKVEQGVRLREPLWTGEDELIATVSESYAFSVVAWDAILAARNTAAAREAGWRGDEVKIEIIGSGKYDKKTDQPKPRPVMRINISTGEIHPATVKEVGIYNERLVKWRQEGSENVRKRVKPNPAALNPPKPKSLLLASSDRGEVFLTHNKAVGSRLEFVPKEDGAAPVLLFEYNTHLAGVETAVGPIQIDHKDYAGEDVKSWLFLPPGASLERREPYPMVVIAYPGLIYDAPPGNEALFSSDIWTMRLKTPDMLEIFAAEGYAVLLPSIPYAKEEGSAEPMPQIMTAIDSALDAAIETGFVDSDRMALTGHSFGGYAALSVAVQSDRFQAIISAMMVSNIASQYGTFSPWAKINAERFKHPGRGVKPGTIIMRPFKLEAHPWEAPDRFIRNSPLFSVENVSTPILLIHADLDTAAHVTQAEEIFTALYLEEKDVQFIKYFGEHHHIEQPENQRDMWGRIFSFLEGNAVTP